MKDGHLNKCKSCTKKDVANNREQKIDKYREYDIERSRSEKRKKNASAANEKYISKYPERIAANKALRKAVQVGEIQKTPCIICGNEKSYGHHHDYSRPLDVNWLCQAHHKAAHKISLHDLESDIDNAKTKYEPKHEREQRKRYARQISGLKRIGESV
jgi:hypothetical protein